MTVVTLKYRTSRPKGLMKHISAWEDLQRTIRLVRSEAPGYGLDPDRIGITGCSAGGHLTLMGVTSSLHQSYNPIDAIDKVSCKVQWGIGIYPAYSLTDGIDDKPNTQGGNEDDNVLVPEYSFDLDTAPMLFIHGDADVWAEDARDGYPVRTPHPGPASALLHERLQPRHGQLHLHGPLLGVPDRQGLQ